jgi:hypothetical protein
MVQIHVVEDENRILFQMIDAVPNPAADVFGKAKQKLECIVNMKSFSFVGPGNLVFDTEEPHGLLVFAVRTIQILPLPFSTDCLFYHDRFFFTSF